MKFQNPNLTFFERTHRALICPFNFFKVGGIKSTLSHLFLVQAA